MILRDRKLKRWVLRWVLFLVIILCIMFGAIITVGDWRLDRIERRLDALEYGRFVIVEKGE